MISSAREIEIVEQLQRHFNEKLVGMYILFRSCNQLENSTIFTP
jgi:hypothetical protein